VIKIDRKKPGIGQQFYGCLGGVAVIANNTWSAFQGKLDLDINWDFGDNKSFDSEEFKKTLTQRVQKNGKLVPGSRGNVSTAFNKANKVLRQHIMFLF